MAGGFPMVLCSHGFLRALAGDEDVVFGEAEDVVTDGSAGKRT